MSMTKGDKLELAKHLYLETSLQQKEIAVRLSINQDTMTAWVRKYGWREIKAARLGSVSNIIANNNNQILAIYDEMTKDGRALLTDKEGTRILNLSTANKNLKKDLDLTTFVEVFEQFSLWVAKVDKPFADKLVNYHYAFLENRAKE